MRRLLGLLVVMLALASVPARAQVITEPKPPPFPDPKKFARGFFAQGEIGALFFVGNTASYAAAGPSFGMRLGYDLFRFLALQLHVAGASHEATLPPPTSGQSLQSYLYAAEVRAQIQIRRVALSLDGGAGLAQLSSNVLDQVAVTNGTLYSLAVVAGAGFDYHTLNRHFSLGLNVDYIWMQAFSDTHALAATAYLRYTH